MINVLNVKCLMLGFDSTKSSLLNFYQTQKLHHAILLHGKKGIGKASFAKKFVAEILNIKSEINPDLLLIEKDAEKKEITVDKVRKISDFLNQTSAISENKFIIIDAASELNRSSSNAILKILEEPHKNNFLILISHNLSRVLPTIRSRCQIIKIPDLSFVDFGKILREENPKISDAEIGFLSAICDNSPADAIEFGEDLTDFYRDFLNAFANKKIPETLLRKISDKNFSFAVFEKTFEFFTSRLIRFYNNSETVFFFNEKEIFSKLTTKFQLKEFFSRCDEILILLRRTTSLNLDKKLTLINIFNQFQ
jgi:DNA polymerase-3 subunit delta'